MTTDNIRYWGFRIHRPDWSFFRDELAQGRLRIGWGWEGTDLRDAANLAAAPHGNRRMYLEVKEGHIILVPYLPDWHSVATVRATEDWDQGYQFKVAKKYFGHIFPATQIGSFHRRRAASLTGGLRRSLKYRGHFWSLDPHSACIDALLKDSAEITDEERLERVVHGAFDDAFDDEAFDQSVYDRLTKEFESERWESVLIQVLEETLYPAPCLVESVGGGISEKRHGTDILVRLPVLGSGPDPVIAIQVKDYGGAVSKGEVDAVMNQIARADEWEKSGKNRVIERVVIMTEANQDQNAYLVKTAEDQGVRLVFADDLKPLLIEYAKRALGLDLTD